MARSLRLMHRRHGTKPLVALMDVCDLVQALPVGAAPLGKMRAGLAVRTGLSTEVLIGPAAQKNRRCRARRLLQSCCNRPFGQARGHYRFWVMVS